MKRLFTIILALAALASCRQIEPEYTVEPTALKISLTELTSKYATVSIIPQNSAAYYYYTVLYKDFYDEYALSDDHIIQICLDIAYNEYIDWRYDYLLQDEKYIASFQSHSLFLGEVSDFYANLGQGESYIILAFCVNPNTKEPMGLLWKKEFTVPQAETTVSTMVIDFGVADDPSDEETSLRISLRPSDKNLPTKEPYVWGWISLENLKKDFGGDIPAYVAELMKSTEEDYEKLAQALRRDVSLELCPDLEVDEDYVVVAVPYRENWRKSLYYRQFTYKKGIELSYSHSKYPEE